MYPIYQIHWNYSIHSYKLESKHNVFQSIHWILFSLTRRYLYGCCFFFLTNEEHSQKTLKYRHVLFLNQAAKVAPLPRDSGSSTVEWRHNHLISSQGSCSFSGRVLNLLPAHWSLNLLCLSQWASLEAAASLEQIRLNCLSVFSQAQFY